MHRAIGMCAISAIIMGAAAACSSSGGTGGGGAASGGPGATIAVGMITARTGALAGERTSDVAVARALIDSVNAGGGIDGHHLVLDVDDDQSTPSGALVAAQALERDGVAGVVFDDATVEGGPAQYLHQQDIPVTGLAASPSWLADDNMFGVTGYGGTGTPATTTIGVIEKRLGVKKMVAVAYGQVPSSTLSASQSLGAAQQVGVGSAGNIGIALSGQNFTSTALQIKSLGVQGLYTGISANDNVSLVTALSQAGLRLPGIVLPTGYEETTLQSASELDGVYFTSATAPDDSTTAAVRSWHAVLSKYAPGVFPGTQEGFVSLSLDLIVDGLKADGGSTSRSALMTAISGITDFTGGGIAAQPVNFTRPKADEPIQGCSYVIELKDGAFSSLQQAPVCGTTASS
jgi:branched-chain amino acid transport system substrate-binding protein